MAASSGKVSVHVRSHFAEWGLEAEREIPKAIEAALDVAVEAAKSAETAENSGDLNKSIHKLPVQAHGRGFTGWIGASDWKANWFETGTAAHGGRGAGVGVRSLTKTGRTRRKASGLVSGVRPLRFLKRGVWSARPTLVEELRVRLSRIRV
jgi:hypothetical protein